MTAKNKTITIVCEQNYPALSLFKKSEILYYSQKERVVKINKTSRINWVFLIFCEADTLLSTLCDAAFTLFSIINQIWNQLKPHFTLFHAVRKPVTRSATDMTKGSDSRGDLWQRVAVTWDNSSTTVKITTPLLHRLLRGERQTQNRRYNHGKSPRQRLVGGFTWGKVWFLLFVERASVGQEAENNYALLNNWCTPSLWPDVEYYFVNTADYFIPL